MADEIKTPTGGDTPAAGTEPKALPPVPNERFKEVIDQKNAAEARALAAEQKAAQDIATERKRVDDLKRLIDERIPAPPPPPEPEWIDPGEKALKEIEAIRKEQMATRLALQNRDATSAIERAVTSRNFVDPDEVRERLAERFELARQFGGQFDAEVEAKRILDKEDAKLGSLKAEWARKKDEAATATASAVRGTSPPVGEAVVTAPPIRSPERKKWDADVEADILRQYRT